MFKALDPPIKQATPKKIKKNISKCKVEPPYTIHGLNPEQPAVFDSFKRYSEIFLSKYYLLFFLLIKITEKEKLAHGKTADSRFPSSILIFPNLADGL